MNDLERIENAIAALEREQLAKLRDWFEAYLAEQWDRQFEDDAPAR